MTCGNHLPTPAVNIVQQNQTEVEENVEDICPGLKGYNTGRNSPLGFASLNAELIAKKGPSQLTLNAEIPLFSITSDSLL